MSAAAWMLVLASPAGAAPTPLKVDQDASSIVATTATAGALGSTFGHAHAVLATQWSAQITYDPENVPDSSVEISVPTSSLRIDTPEAGQAAEMEIKRDAESQQKLQKKMLSSRFLDAAEHPSLTFKSTSVSGGRNGTLEVTGDISIHGVSKEITVPMKVTRMGEGQYRFSGSFEVLQSAFGFSPESVAGVVKVADPVTVHLVMVARAG